MPVNSSGTEYPAPTPEIVTKQLPITALFSLKGKVASITGASIGIGWAVAVGYAQSGADLALWYNSHDPKEKAEALAKEYGVKVKTYKASVADPDAVEATVKQQIADFGKIDVFVANAGIAWTGGPLLDTPDHKLWNDVVRTDFDAVYYCSKAVGQHFRERKTGSLIFTSSVSAKIVNVPQRQAAYNAAKAGVTHLAKSLAVEWATFARVNSVSPGYIDTDILSFADEKSRDTWMQQIPAGRFAQPSEIAGIYVYLASDASTYTTGSDMVVDGGFSLL